MVFTELRGGAGLKASCSNGTPHAAHATKLHLVATRWAAADHRAVASAFL